MSTHSANRRSGPKFSFLRLFEGTGSAFRYPLSNAVHLETVSNSTWSEENIIEPSSFRLCTDRAVVGLGDEKRTIGAGGGDRLMPCLGLGGCQRGKYLLLVSFDAL